MRVSGVSLRFFVYLPQGDKKPWRESIDACRRLGPTLTELPQRFEAGDVLVTWSPFRLSHRWAAYRDVKAAGGRAIILENGWLSPLAGVRQFQVALDGWNGTGRFPHGGPERWAAWNVPLTEWRRGGRHVLVVGQKRQTIADPRRMPNGWAQSLRLATDRPVFRRMPNAARPLADDLRDAHCTVSWTSTTAIKGLIAGIPAFHCGPNSLCPELSKAGLDVDNPIYPERRPAFERMAWCQWSAAEIAAGEPFARLLAVPHDGASVRVEEPPAIRSQYTLLGRVRDLALLLPGDHWGRRRLGMS